MSNSTFNVLTYGQITPPVTENGKVKSGSIAYEVETQAEKLSMNELDFHQNILTVLMDYFKYALTIIVQKRQLYPTEAFRTTRVFNLKVPEFLHPLALEYIDEVTRTLVIMIKRNASNGCVINIWSEGNKTKNLLQRFVFLTKGTLDFIKPNLEDLEDKQYHKIRNLKLDKIKSLCKASLLKLLISDKLVPIAYPELYKWSISLGATKEFINYPFFKELWNKDPCRNNFPWRLKTSSPAALKNVRKKSDIQHDSKDNFLSTHSLDNSCKDETKTTSMVSNKTEYGTKHFGLAHTTTPMDH